MRSVPRFGQRIAFGSRFRSNVRFKIPFDKIGLFPISDGELRPVPRFGQRIAFGSRFMSNVRFKIPFNKIGLFPISVGELYGTKSA